MFLMPYKDYYTILDLKTSASMQEVKQRFRELAMQYHPDKNNNDPKYTLQFTEYKEAYHTLTNEAKRNVYLQERWLRKANGEMVSNICGTPVSLLKKYIALERSISSADFYRLNKTELFTQITAPLSDDAIQQLHLYGQVEMNDTIVSLILKCTDALSYSQAIAIQSQLQKIQMGDIKKNQLAIYFMRRRNKAVWEKFSPLWIGLATALLCFLIYYMAN